MRQLYLSIILIFCTEVLIAAPLESGYSQAPRVSASSQEKASAFLEARNKVIEAAEKYLNIPYRYGGLNRNGVDCSGLIYLSFRDALGVSPPRSTTALYSWVEKIPGDRAQIRDRAQTGDLLFFKTDNSAAVTHVGLYLGGGNFIHSASSGSRTGVIHSNLNERYWAGVFVAAGRAFPEIPPNTIRQAGSAGASSGTVNPSADNSGQANAQPKTSDSSKDTKGNERSGWLLLGAAFAPSFNIFLEEGPFIRGYTSQIRIGAAVNVFNTRLIFGMEMRPEYDTALDVFRLPFTLSLGFDDKYTIFAGPVLSFGEPSLDKIERDYSGGTSWIGTVGITAAPFILKTKIGEFAPYIETAWQYYIPKDDKENVKADILAGSRFSTGLRWTVPIR